VLDVGAALAPAGEHQHGVDQDLAAVVKWQPSVDGHDARRERVTQPETIGEGPQGVQSDMAHDLVAAGLHLHPCGAATVHL
jgi:hypothetical protein